MLEINPEFYYDKAQYRSDMDSKQCGEAVFVGSHRRSCTETGEHTTHRTLYRGKTITWEDQVGRSNILIESKEGQVIQEWGRD